MDKKKIYFCFPISGPNNGVKIISQHIYDWLLYRDELKIKLIDTSQAIDFKNFGRFNLKKIWNTIGLFQDLIKIKKREIAYMNLTPQGYAFYRDIIFLGIFILKGGKANIHIHANGLEKKINILNKWLFKQCNIIVINKNQYNKLSALNLKVILLPNALPDYFANKTFIKKSNEVLKLLYLSNLSQEKGIFRLNKIIQKIQDSQIKCELHICGGILDLEAENMMNILKGYEFVKYHGPVSNEEIKFNQYLNSDFLLFLSNIDYEVSPLVYIESLMSGLPIITTKQIVSDSIIKNNCAFQLDADCENLISIIDDNSITPNKLEVLKSNCRDNYIKNYSFTRYMLVLKKTLFEA